MSVQERPNILFICTDQQRYDALGCYGNPHIKTPVLDRLAAEGVLFEQCYVQNPICSPSRASLMTGRYPHGHGLWANGARLPEREEMFTTALAASGYDCGMVGKLHLAPCHGGRTEERLDDGFRYFRWAHDPAQSSPENDYHRWLAEHHPDHFAAANAQPFVEADLKPKLFDDMPTEAHYSRWVSERSIDFLRSERDPDKPFFLWANFFDPHHPFVAPKEYLDLYDASQLPPSVTRPNELASKPAIQREMSRETYAGHSRGFVEHTPDEIQQFVAAYYAMVTLIDDEVGRMLAALDALGLRESTLVVFSSDHGEMLGDHNILLKGPALYDPAVRVPLIMHWPGHLPAGERRTELVQWLDLGPTFLAAAGLPPLTRNQGQNLLPLAHGDAAVESRGWAICEYRNSLYANDYEPPVHATMLRRDRWKLVVYHGVPASNRERTGELYDLATDPRELTNLWCEARCQSTRAALEAFLFDTLVATEDRSQPIEADW